MEWVTESQPRRAGSRWQVPRSQPSPLSALGTEPPTPRLSVPVAWPTAQNTQQDVSVSGLLIVSCKGLFFCGPLWCWNGSQGLVYVRQGALSDVGTASPLSCVLVLCRFCNGNKSRYYLHCERKREVVFRSSGFSSQPVCSSQAPSV